MAGAADPFRDAEVDGATTFGFPDAPPDLVVGIGSPEFCRRRNEAKDNVAMVSANHSPERAAAPVVDGSPLASVYPCRQVLDGIPSTTDSPEDGNGWETLLGINAGNLDDSVVCGDDEFQIDSFFVGGDIIGTNAEIGEGKGLALYQTARFGNFSYKFPDLEAGSYSITLHLAEIVFTDGPPGMRVFDVFLQGEKVASRVDIYAQVGSNKPLVISDLRASVRGEEGLTISFEGVTGNPLVNGISMRSDIHAADAVNARVSLNPADHRESLLEGTCDGCKKLRRDYDLLSVEKSKTRRELEDAKKENDLKKKECYEAWMSLQELQAELMRKSMHVGSLAFAVEGQVKEKARWFSALKELSENFELVKSEHIKLLYEASECRRHLTDMSSMTAAVQSAMSSHFDLVREHKELKEKFVKESRGRKDLYNKVLELKGNIRVFCRCRPLNLEEMSRGASTIVEFEYAKDGELTVRAPGTPRKVFKFDSVFGPQADQEMVFENTAPFATSVLDGYNVCIFAYGQTGTGKTFTMEGTKEDRGVNYRTLEELFRLMKERQGLSHYEISVSVLEVYNEQIRDLLSGSQSGTASKRLEIKQVAEGIHHVPGLVEAPVSNMNEVWEVLQTGSNARAVGATNCNEHSSRSHCIHCVMVKGRNIISGECTRSKLWLIDLAGSERVAKTDVQGDRLKEAQNINKSLSSLGDVISALATKSPHVPFRNSKLTHLLQDSLGGDSKTLMFVQISPTENDVAETLCSLNFASRVRGIELGPAKKQLDASEAFKSKHMLEKAKQEMKSKDEQVRRMEDMVNCQELKMKSKDLLNKSLQDKVKELEAQLLIERKITRHHVDNKIAENQQQKQHQQEHDREQLVHALSNSNRPPLTTRPLFDNQWNIPENLTAPKDLLGNEHLSRANRAVPKENKPELLAEEMLLLHRKASRMLIPTNNSGRTSIVPAPRRESLIPAPAIKPMETPLALFTTIRGTASPQAAPPSGTTEEGGVGSGATQNQQQPRSASRRFSNILRRSLQKKVIIKPPLQQYARRAASGKTEGGGALENVVGTSTGRVRRAMETNRGQQQKWKRDKERGWNHGSVTARNIT